MNQVMKAISRKLGLIMAIWLSIAAATHAEIVRVQKDATGNGDGSSWADAYNELRVALLQVPQGTEIWVATWDEEDWVYTPTADQDVRISFILRNNVEIYGGFLGTHHPTLPEGETSREQRDYVENVTTLSGDLGGGATSRVVVEGTEGVDARAVLDGFTITDGSWHGIENYKASPWLENLLITGIHGINGSGMHNYTSSPWVTNCTFSYNNAGVGQGGGMYNFVNSNPIVTDCLFLENEARYGGGMYNADGNAPMAPSSPWVSGCTFQGNIADLYGGGVWNGILCEPLLTDCDFIENGPVWNDGGGLLNSGGSPKLTRCNFIRNYADTGGAGFSHKGDGLATVVDCSFIENEITYGGDGAGMFAGAGATTRSKVINTVFIDNLAGDPDDSSRGGGLYAGSGNLLQVVNALFIGNSAGGGGEFLGDGGGLFSNGGHVIDLEDPDQSSWIINCTFASNSATGEGGGAYFNNANVIPVTNSIAWGNSDSGGMDESAQIHLANGAEPVVTYSCIQECSAFCGDPDDGNIGDDPEFADPVGGDYRLTGCSPGIDAADTDAVPPDGEDVDEDDNTGEPTPDLNLNDRVVDDPFTDNTGVGDPPVVDMGAYEYQGLCEPDACARGDGDGDGAVTGLDIQPMVDCLLDEAPGCTCACLDMDLDGAVTLEGDVPCFVAVLLEYDDCIAECNGGPGGQPSIQDCNENQVADVTDIFAGTSEDCNNNFIPDECDVDPADPDGDGEVSSDLNANGVPDECEADCNGNGVPDDKDIADQTSLDVNGNGVPDECEPDCNTNGLPDDWDISQGTSADCNGNGMPDECEADCNNNGVPDDCDIDPSDPDGDGQVSPDCNANNWPDECDLALFPPFGSLDCNVNGIPDECDIANCTGDPACGDCNNNGFPDACDIAKGVSQDANGNGIPDECEGPGGPGGRGPEGPGEGYGDGGNDEAWALFIDWSLDQTWGPDAEIDCWEQFALMVDTLEALGLPIRRPGM